MVKLKRYAQPHDKVFGPSLELKWSRHVKYVHHTLLLEVGRALNLVLTTWQWGLLWETANGKEHKFTRVLSSL